jgi:hypothetical protein
MKDERGNKLPVKRTVDGRLHKPRIRRVRIDTEIRTFTCHHCQKHQPEEEAVYGRVFRFEPLEHYCKKCAKLLGVAPYVYQSNDRSVGS